MKTDAIVNWSEGEHSLSSKNTYDCSLETRVDAHWSKDELGITWV